MTETKQAKTAGKDWIDFSTLVTLPTGTVAFDAVTAGKRERYLVSNMPGEPGSYDVCKMAPIDEPIKGYTCSTFLQTCTCPGFKAGYVCRHLRMVDALVARELV